MRSNSVFFVLAPLALAEPNFSFHASERLIQYATHLPDVDNVRKVEEVVQGGKLTAQVRTKGSSRIELEPNRERVTYLLSFSGEAESNDQVWTRPGVKLNSTLEATLTVSKKVFFQGLSMMCSPSTAVTKVDLTFTGGGPKTIGNVIAKTKAKKDEEEKEGFVAEKLSTELCRELDLQTSRAVSEGGPLAELKGLVRNPDGGTEVLPFTSESTSDYAIFFVDIKGQEALEPGELFVYPKDDDLGFDIHESAVNNLTQMTKAGKYETDNKLFSVFKLLMADEPYDLRPHDRTVRWQFRYADKNPIQVKFQDEELNIEVNAQSWRRTAPGQARQEILTPFTVRASYRLSRQPFYAELVGPVELDYQGASEEAEFLQTKFSAFFAPQLKFEGLDIPRGSNLEKFNALKPIRAEANGGWLHLQWKLQP